MGDHMEKKKQPLTARQKKYCRERVKGKSLADSYYDAGYSKGNKKDVAAIAACRLERDERIKAEMERLTRKAEAGAVLDRQQRIALLSDMAADEDRKDDSRQRAIDMLNRMQGDYTERTITEIKGGLDISLEDKKKMILEALQTDD